MSIPQALTSFAGLSTYWGADNRFDRQSVLADFDWYGSGHGAPSAPDDVDAGRVTLGGVGAGATDYIQGQKIGATVVLDRLAKTYEFLWAVQLSSATLARALVGFAVTNTNALGTNITNGFGFLANLSGGPTAGYWVPFLAKSSTIQFTTYSMETPFAADTSEHVLGVRIVTDPNTQGAGQITFFCDNQNVGSFANSSSAILPTSALRLTLALGNGSAVAQSLKVRECPMYGKR